MKGAQEGKGKDGKGWPYLCGCTPALSARTREAGIKYLLGKWRGLFDLGFSAFDRAA